MTFQFSKKDQSHRQEKTHVKLPLIAQLRF